MSERFNALRECEAKYYELQGDMSTTPPSREHLFIDWLGRMIHEATLTNAVAVAGDAAAPQGWTAEQTLVREARWLIFFADAEMRPELFTGEGAEVTARRRYRDNSLNWNCYLFVEASALAAPVPVDTPSDGQQ